MSTLVTLMEESWPPAERIALGPLVLRRGLGGGQRVSAATPRGPVIVTALEEAEAAMRAMAQAPLFLVTPQDDALDAALAARGYAVKDPSLVYAAPLADLAIDPPERMTSFAHWPPMAITTALWAEGGIGPARAAIMDRAEGPKTAILGRAEDRACGAAFVALAGQIAFVHALHVSPAMRRRGAALNMMRAAAAWAGQNGATGLGLAVTRGNQAARALYESLGMPVREAYHYRHLPS